MVQTPPSMRQSSACRLSHLPHNLLILRKLRKLACQLLSMKRHQNSHDVDQAQDGHECVEP